MEWYLQNAERKNCQQNSAHSETINQTWRGSIFLGESWEKFLPADMYCDKYQ